MTPGVLVTGASNFLGYHVIKRLNEQGARPRVLITPGGEQSPGARSLDRLEVDRTEGDYGNPDSLDAACRGMETVFHLHFRIDLGDGPEAEAELRAGNVICARNVLAAATRSDVVRVVLSSSTLAIGLNPAASPLDETAEREIYRYRLPYAESRSEAEREALARPEGPIVVAVNPAFTMGPEDFVGAPANALAVRMARRSFRLTAPIGFGVVDVRDYADGVLRAAESGRHGQRYVLSGHNVMTRELHEAVAEVAGNRPPRWLFSVRRWMVEPIVAGAGLWSRLRGKRPKISRALLDIWGKHAWYDTTLARNELGWEARPLRETLADTLAWQRDNEQ